MRSVDIPFAIAIGEKYLTNTMYITTNEKLEKWTNKIIEIYLKIIFPISLLSSVVLCYFNYFVLNLSEESFVLLLPYSYVYLIFDSENYI